MRITKISVRELFGIQTFNYDIELKLEPRITIIHGPNGSGKTVLFKMIDGLFNGHYHVFWKYPFSEFVVTLEGGDTIRVKRESETKTKRYPAFEISHSRLTPPFRIDLDSDWSRVYSSRMRRRALEAGEEWIMFDPDELTRVSGEFYPPDEFLAHYAEEFIARKSPEPNWLRKLQQKLKVNFIRANRLLVEKSDSNVGRRPRQLMATAITENSQDLSVRIQERKLEAEARAKALDQTFPKRVVNTVIAGGNPWSMDTIRRHLGELEAERKRLTEAGLLETGAQEEEFQLPSTTPEVDQDRTLTTTLTIYIKDNREKLRVYRDLADRIELFKDIIQSMLRHKRLQISKDGFALKSGTGESIPLEELSSGEQHLLVLVYNLLFRRRDNTDELILIDEPEISLHISWQKRFIDDLARINKLSGFDVIIATHSPSIINGRLDLMVGIQGATGEES